MNAQPTFMGLEQTRNYPDGDTVIPWWWRAVQKKRALHRTDDILEGEAREVEGKPRMGGWERRGVGKKKVWTDPRGK